MNITDFVTRWKPSASSERSNSQTFLGELCDLLGVPRPDPKVGDPDRDRYVFEREAVLHHEGGGQSLGFIDLYKQGFFILEAKQRLRGRFDEGRTRAKAYACVGDRHAESVRPGAEVLADDRRSAALHRHHRHRLLLRSLRIVRWHAQLSEVSGRGQLAHLSREARIGAAKSSSPIRTLRLIENFLKPLAIVKFTSVDAIAYAQVRAKLERAGTPIGPLDTLIASQAVSRKLVLVSNNEREFRRVSRLRVENWAH